MKKIRFYLWLFCINLFISTFTFGGGYVVVPMIRKYYVERRQLFSEEELLDLAAIAQSSPGAIAVNLSSLAGYRTAGIPGAVISCLSSVLPPLLILSALSAGYEVFRNNQAVAAVLKGMEAGAAALVVDFVYDMCRAVFQEKHLLASVTIPAVFVGSFFLQLPVIFLLLLSCCLFVLEILWKKKKGGGEKQ